MNAKALADLLLVTELAYQRAQQALAEISKEERDLRAEIARLRALQGIPTIETGQDLARAASGADVMWQGWLTTSISRLNMALARVLATKAHHQTTTKTAFGKRQVIREILKKSKAEDKEAVSKSSLNQAIDAALRAGGGQ